MSEVTSKERVEAIKECELMARGLAETLTCQGDTGHYCPNCGNGLHNARVFAEALAKKIAALGVPAHEPSPLQIERNQLALRVKTLECERDAWRGSSNAYKAEVERMKAPLADDDGPGEEDGSWAEGWEQRAGPPPGEALRLAARPHNCECSSCYEMRDIINGTGGQT